jgi:hypothetical protein
MNICTTYRSTYTVHVQWTFNNGLLSADYAVTSNTEGLGRNQFCCRISAESCFINLMTSSIIIITTIL